MINEEKASAVMNFIDLIVNSREAGFIDSDKATIAEFYQAARAHCGDTYGVRVEDIESKHGSCVARNCGAKI